MHKAVVVGSGGFFFSFPWETSFVLTRGCPKGMAVVLRGGLKGMSVPLQQKDC